MVGSGLVSIATGEDEDEGVGAGAGEDDSEVTTSAATLAEADDELVVTGFDDAGAGGAGGALESPPET